MFNIEYQSAQTANALQTLLGNISDHSAPLADDDDNEDCEDKQQDILQSITKQSPYTKFFHRVLVESRVQPADDDDKHSRKETQNQFYSPPAFKVLTSVMHLFPLWCAALQGNQVRFASNAKETTSLETAHSNAAVESHFKTVKHYTLRKTSRLRPADFLNKELKYIQGKINETMLPKKTVKATKRLPAEDQPEKWSKRRKPARYADERVARKILTTDKSTPAKQRQVNSRKKHATAVDSDEAELDDDGINAALTLLHQKYGKTILIQNVGLGMYVGNKSMPRFVPSTDKRFVQILNVGDHWICLTNVFEQDTHDVYVFDSLFQNINTTTTVQITSLLRSDESADEITFNLRNFKQQSRGTRLCGFYAVAAAFACCEKVDPSGVVYDEKMLQTHYNRSISTKSVSLFPVHARRPITQLLLPVTKPKLYCRCQSVSDSDMIQCTACRNWYHQRCVPAIASEATRRESVIWLGPCCYDEENDILTI